MTRSPAHPPATLGTCLAPSACANPQQRIASLRSLPLDEAVQQTRGGAVSHSYVRAAPEPGS